MKITISLFAFILPLFAAFAATPADKGVYQWGVEVDGVISKETKKPPRAYLWIPEKCVSLKAVVLANDNMLEEPLFADLPQSIPETTSSDARCSRRSCASRSRRAKARWSVPTDSTSARGQRW